MSTKSSSADTDDSDTKTNNNTTARTGKDTSGSSASDSDRSSESHSSASSGSKSSSKSASSDSGNTSSDSDTETNQQTTTQTETKSAASSKRSHRRRSKKGNTDTSMTSATSATTTKNDDDEETSDHTSTSGSGSSNTSRSSSSSRSSSGSSNSDSDDSNKSDETKTQTDLPTADADTPLQRQDTAAHPPAPAPVIEVSRSIDFADDDPEPPKPPAAAKADSPGDNLLAVETLRDINLVTSVQIGEDPSESSSGTSSASSSGSSGSSSRSRSSSSGTEASGTEGETGTQTHGSKTSRTSRTSHTSRTSRTSRTSATSRTSSSGSGETSSSGEGTDEEGEERSTTTGSPSRRTNTATARSTTTASTASTRSSNSKTSRTSKSSKTSRTSNTSSTSAKTTEEDSTTTATEKVTPRPEPSKLASPPKPDTGHSPHAQVAAVRSRFDEETPQASHEGTMPPDNDINVSVNMAAPDHDVVLHDPSSPRRADDAGSEKTRASLEPRAPARAMSDDIRPLGKIPPKDKDDDSKTASRTSAHSEAVDLKDKGAKAPTTATDRKEETAKSTGKDNKTKDKHHHKTKHHHKDKDIDNEKKREEKKRRKEKEGKDSDRRSSATSKPADDDAPSASSVTTKSHASSKSKKSSRSKSSKGEGESDTSTRRSSRTSKTKSSRATTDSTVSSTTATAEGTSKRSSRSSRSRTTKTSASSDADDSDSESQSTTTMASSHTKQPVPRPEDGNTTPSRPKGMRPVAGTPTPMRESRVESHKHNGAAPVIPPTLHEDDIALRYTLFPMIFEQILQATSALVSPQMLCKALFPSVVFPPTLNAQKFSDVLQRNEVKASEQLFQLFQAKDTQDCGLIRQAHALAVLEDLEVWSGVVPVDVSMNDGKSWAANVPCSVTRRQDNLYVNCGEDVHVCVRDSDVLVLPGPEQRQFIALVSPDGTCLIRTEDPNLGASLNRILDCVKFIMMAVEYCQATDWRGVSCVDYNIFTVTLTQSPSDASRKSVLLFVLWTAICRRLMSGPMPKHPNSATATDLGTLTLRLFKGWNAGGGMSTPRSSPPWCIEVTLSHFDRLPSSLATIDMLLHSAAGHVVSPVLTIPYKAASSKSHLRVVVYVPNKESVTNRKLSLDIKFNSEILSRDVCLARTSIALSELVAKSTKTLSLQVDMDSAGNRPGSVKAEVKHGAQWFTEVEVPTWAGPTLCTPESVLGVTYLWSCLGDGAAHDFEACDPVVPAVVSCLRDPAVAKEMVKRHSEMHPKCKSKGVVTRHMSEAEREGVGIAALELQMARDPAPFRAQLHILR
eukprot:PhM_4_TR17400/c0_g1_i1/m.82132